MDFNKRTVFVIGAGASKPYGLPIGEDLKTIMEGAINDHPDLNENGTNLNNAAFFKFLKEKNYELEFIKDIINQIVGTGSNSVDEFLMEKEENSRESKLIKILVYYFISQRCTESSLLGNDWIEPLVNYLMDNFREPFLTGSISFISFNYDQLLRAKVEYIVKNKYHIQDYRYDKITHVYGKLLDFSFNPSSLISNEELMEIHDESKYISLYRKGPPQDTKKIYEKLKNAENIIFLGYGFNRENNHLLIGEDRSAMNFYAKNSYMTSLGFSKFEREEICNIFGGKVNVEDKNCLQMINSLIKRTFI